MEPTTAKPAKTVEAGRPDAGHTGAAAVDNTTAADSEDILVERVSVPAAQEGKSPSTPSSSVGTGEHLRSAQGVLPRTEASGQQLSTAVEALPAGLVDILPDTQTVAIIPLLPALPIAIPAGLPEAIDAIPVEQRARRVEIAVLFGALRSFHDLTQLYFSEEPLYPGQLPDKKLNGTHLYESGRSDQRVFDNGPAVAVQLQFQMANRLAMTLGLERWEHRYRSSGQDISVPMYVQHIAAKETQWLSGLGARYHLLGKGRWRFSMGGALLLTLYRKASYDVAYWRDGLLVDTEKVSQNDPWEEFVRWQLEGQLAYQCRPGWEISLRSGAVLGKSPLPYLGLQLRYRISYK